jgi:hypothetical protein
VRAVFPGGVESGAFAFVNESESPAVVSISKKEVRT